MMDDRTVELGLRAQPPADPIYRSHITASPPDVTRIMRGATTTSPPWRSQSVFSATKFVVAGAIVALFGGFLLAGVLTQPSDKSLPAAASPTTTATPDLLPGVDLVTEEVEPGVFRVTSDGVRDLSRITDHTGLYEGGAPYGNIAAGRDGSVWWFGPEGFFRLGDADTHAWSTSELVEFMESRDELEVAPDGALLRLSDPEHALAFDGHTWTEREVVAEEGTIWLRGGLRVRDGERWSILLTSFANPAIDRAAVGADGTIWIRPMIGDDFTVLSRYGLNDSETPFREWRDFSRDLPLIGGHPGFFQLFEVAPDGSVWFDPVGDFEQTGTDCDGAASFDGETVTYYLRERCVYAMDIAPDGHVWLQAGEPGEFRRQHGSATTIHTYVITPEAVAANE